MEMLDEVNKKPEKLGRESSGGNSVYDYCSKRLNINGIVQQPVDILRKSTNTRVLLSM